MDNFLILFCWFDQCLYQFIMYWGGVFSNLLGRVYIGCKLKVNNQYFNCFSLKISYKLHVFSISIRWIKDYSSILWTLLKRLPWQRFTIVPVYTRDIQKQIKDMIAGPYPKLKMYCMQLSLENLRLLIGILTGHCKLNATYIGWALKLTTNIGIAALTMTQSNIY